VFGRRALTYRDVAPISGSNPLKAGEIKVSPDGALCVDPKHIHDPGYKVYGGELIASGPMVLSGASTGGGGAILDEHFSLREFEAYRGWWFAVLTAAAVITISLRTGVPHAGFEGDELTVTNAYKVDGRKTISNFPTACR
jgi:hypothetical protein